MAPKTSGRPPGLQGARVPSTVVTTGDNRRRAPIAEETDDLIGDDDSRDPCVPEDETYLVTRPHVTLYADASDSSVIAFEALANHDVRFAVKPAPEPGKIFAMWDDLRFDGLERIKMLAEIKQEVGAGVIAALEESMPERMARRNEEGLAKLAARNECQRREAWKALQRIRAKALAGSVS